MISVNKWPRNILDGLMGQGVTNQIRPAEGKCVSLMRLIMWLIIVSKRTTKFNHFSTYVKNYKNIIINYVYCLS